MAGGRAVSMGGKVVGADAAVVSVYDRGFLFGDGVFEVLRTYAGRPFALAEHLARLRRSAGRVAIDLPWSDEQLAADVERVVAAAGLGDAYVRVMVTRGTGPVSLDPDTARDPRRGVPLEPLAPPPPSASPTGVPAPTLR